MMKICVVVDLWIEEGKFDGVIVVIGNVFIVLF